MGKSVGAFTLLLAVLSPALAQDVSTGALRGTVLDPTGARVTEAVVTLRNPANGDQREQRGSPNGTFAFSLLPPALYDLEIHAQGFQATRYTQIKVDLGATVALIIKLKVATQQEVVEVEGGAPLVETQSSEVTDVIDQRAVEDLPLNGRRFSDLAVLTGGVTQDPRSLTSAGNGDLAFGGVRGFQSTFLVDGSDNNNGFFAQARGRYRAPYQFSNEVIQEFRVSSNLAGAEVGRSGGAVINVVTKSGGNVTHGSLFYYLRDGEFAAVHPFVRKKYPDRQHQFGGSVSGPIKRGRIFYFASFDQHIFHIPTVVRFEDGSSQVVPQPADFDLFDQQLVADTATQLSTLAGQFRTALTGQAAFLKMDFKLSPRHDLGIRLNLSRFGGENNVFFDDASPFTTFGIAGNGEESVATESMNASLNSVFGTRWTSHLRVQFSRDDQDSSANSPAPITQVSGLISGFGRSSILPRATNEHRWHIAETVGFYSPRHTLKFGGDAMVTRTENFFPSLFGGKYIFDNIRVNPFTFVPQTFGLSLTPLRAYAHVVPRYYIQNFGSAVNHPNSNDFSLFVQDTIRLGDHLALNLGVRYDLQTMSVDGLQTNPLWPDSGKLPSDTNNVSPRIGFAASFGPGDRPFVTRGGYGMFYVRIPQIYVSTVARENGLNQQRLFLDNADFFQRQVFPVYPAPLVACGVTATSCALPVNVAGFATTGISSFTPRYQTPYVQQANLSVEKEVLRRTAVGAAYLFVAGKHLIRARDANLPQPVTLDYPVFDDTGTTFTGEFLPVTSFSQWRFAPSLTCPFPPCIDPLQRPINSVGAINVFETAASSVYHGLTISAKRRMTNNFYFRFAYTWAKAIDTGPDALLIGSSQVENTFNTRAERALSVTDQRHRMVFAMTADPMPFGRDRKALARIFNDWKIATIVSAGSGRPLSARLTGDANRDGNFNNDRLAGARRNRFTGPDYFSTEARLTRKFVITPQWRLEASLEAFNLFNRNNKRVDLSDNGFASSAAAFVEYTKTVNGLFYPGYLRQRSTFLQPMDSYAPRQIQLSLRVKF
ncbi:MAG: TonB-dependent receptor [Acidobacteriales bacterium]|nr:TonB-dependent receptor [Terriglobales bacterium]